MVYGGKTGFEDLQETVTRTVKALMPYLDKFDSIAASGTSGLVVAAPVSVLTGKPLVVVRKKDDGSHSSQLLEGRSRMGKRVLFLDDFVSMGRTRAWVRQHVVANKGDLVGQFMYYHGEGSEQLEWYDADTFRRIESYHAYDY